MTNMSITPPVYSTWLQDVKTCIQSARIDAARAVNRELILLYWDLGRGIVEKQELMGWGKSVVDKLSADLMAEYPGLQGFSAKNLWLMRPFDPVDCAPGSVEAGLPVAGVLCDPL